MVDRLLLIHLVMKNILIFTCYFRRGRSSDSVSDSPTYKVLEYMQRNGIGLYELHSFLQNLPDHQSSNSTRKAEHFLEKFIHEQKHNREQ